MFISIVKKIVEIECDFIETVTNNILLSKYTL